MGNNIKFISLDSLKNSFLKGIDSFIELYNIQNNKNIISSTLGNAAINMGKFIKSDYNFAYTNEITAEDVTKANTFKAAINRCDDNESIKLFNNFGEKLKNINSNQKCISSMYSFICLSIFYNSSVTTSYNKDYNFSTTLLKLYLTPDTKNKDALKNIISDIGNSLQKLRNNEFINSSSSSPQQILTETDKIWAVICKLNPELAKNSLGEDAYKRYIQIDIHTNNKYLSNKTNSNGVIDQQFETLSLNFKKTIEIIENITNAIKAYILKFRQHTENPGVGRQISQYASSEAKQFVTGLGWASIPLCNQVQYLMGGNSPSSPVLKILQGIAPPDLIGQLLMSIATNVAEIAFQSKYYGVINRHGITGQVRSFLLQNYLEMFSAFLSNNYYNIVLISTNQSNNTDTDFDNMCKMLNQYITDFRDAYTKSIRILPNHEKTGSLYYYLKMYADPDKNFSKNTKLTESWNNTKLKKII